MRRKIRKRNKAEIVLEYALDIALHHLEVPVKKKEVIVAVSLLFFRVCYWILVLSFLNNDGHQANRAVEEDLDVSSFIDTGEIPWQ